MCFMYALTFIVALPLGLMMVLTPKVLTDSLGWVLDEPLFPGAYGGCLIVVLSVHLQIELVSAGVDSALVEGRIAGLPCVLYHWYGVGNAH
jgi:hypothetical protein